jgi:hypothetical protein
VKRTTHELQTAVVKKRALVLQRQASLIPGRLYSSTKSPSKAIKEKNWTPKVEIRMLLASVSLNVRKHFEDLDRQPTRKNSDFPKEQNKMLTRFKR